MIRTNYGRKKEEEKTLEIEEAAKKGEDLTKHVFGGKSVSRASPELYMSNPKEGCEPLT